VGLNFYILTVVSMSTSSSLSWTLYVKEIVVDDRHVITEMGDSVASSNLMCPDDPKQENPQRIYPAPGDTAFIAP
jgi:hypothetical protein